MRKESLNNLKKRDEGELRGTIVCRWTFLIEYDVGMKSHPLVVQEQIDEAWTPSSRPAQCSVHAHAHMHAHTHAHKILST